MTETTNTPFSGLMVKARPMPDLMYPRYQKWYNTSTYISSALDTYLGHPVAAGRNFVSTVIAERDWHQTAPPARAANTHSTTNAMDITTPAYMLAGTAGLTDSEDTLVGLDYANVPIRFFKDVEALDAHHGVDTGNLPTFARVLAIKHQLTFINHSRFPLEIYWNFLPIGHLFPVPNGILVPLIDIMAQTYSKITVPAIRDAGDRSAKNTIDVDVNLKQLWPNEYAMAPGQNMTGATAAASTDHANSPWMSVHNSTTSATFRNIPPGQIRDDHNSTPDFSINGPTCGLRLQWFAKLQNPRDLGVTVEDADHAGGDYSGNSYDVHAKMGWLIDYMRVGNATQIHKGEKAYPSAVA